MRSALRLAAVTVVSLVLGACGDGGGGPGQHPIPVAAVTVSPNPVAATIGETVQLSAVLTDALSNPITGRTVTWSSDNQAAATVSSAGLVTAVAAGSATITASAEGKSGSAPVTVTAVAVPVVTVEVTPPAPSIHVGATVTLGATTKDGLGNVLVGREVTWSSSAQGVATVDPSGVVTGISAGTAIITATSETRTGWVTVTVNAPVATVEVSPPTPTVAAGGTVQLAATLEDAQGNVLSGRAVSWSSDATGIATVSETGLVTGQGEGAATITATSEGQSGTATVSVTLNFELITAGGEFTCGNPTTGGALCWGEDGAGALGNGPGGDASTPGRVTSTGVRLEGVSAGRDHACAIGSDGNVWCWGANTRGQLGDGTTTSRTTPVRSTSAGNFDQVVAAAEYTCALDTAKEAYCWGLNLSGQLGTATNEGTTNANSTPVKVGGHTFTQIAAFDGHTCGLEANTAGTWCWGSNTTGQLGINNITPRSSTPVLASGARQFSGGIGVGADHSCGIESDGTLYCWGSNALGQLGVDPVATPATFTPTAVSGGRAYDRVSGGFRFTCGLTSTGRIYCWGRNDYGQLGGGTSGSPDDTPGLVSGGLDFKQLDAGVDHACGITTDNLAYCWGRQNDGSHPAAGALGDGSTTNSAEPVKVAGQP